MNLRHALTAALLASASLAEPAWASSCCVGASTTLPTRLGKCETGMVGTSATGSGSIGRVDATGRLAPSSLTEASLRAQLLGGYRWKRWGQIGVALPFVMTHRRSGANTSLGGGVGDLRLVAVFEPMEERFANGRRTGPPVPVVTVGTRLPTGRSWKGSTDPMGADITGRPGGAVSALLTVERTSDRIPWTVGMGTEVEADADGVRPSLDALATLGGAFGTNWSLVGVLNHRSTWSRGGASWARTASTQAGLQATYSVYATWRAWVGVSSELPIPGLAEEDALDVRGTAGFGYLF